MKKITVLFVCILLSSCGNINLQVDTDETSDSQVWVVESSQEQQENSQANALDGIIDEQLVESTTTTPNLEGPQSWSGLTSLVPSSYKENPEFLYCAAQNVDMCIGEVASMSQEQVSCEDYILESSRVSCTDSQAFSQAVTSLDTSLCESISWDQQNCVREVITQKAIQASDSQICSGLDSDFRRSCENTVIQISAVANKDPSLCDGIVWFDDTDTMEKEFCIQEVQFMIEEEQRNQELPEVSETEEVPISETVIDTIE